MPNGGSMPITNVSSQGDLDYSVSKRLGNFTGNLQGSVNAPSMSSNYVQPKLSYDRKALSSYVTPSGFGGGIQGNKAYVNYDQNREGRDVYRSGAAGYNTDKVNVNANANFRNNLLENAGVTGSYNVSPNLSVVGNYNVSQGESGLNPNYFAGFKFNKTFKEGGNTNWTPTVAKPYMRTSPAGNSGYIDNTRVNSLNLANRKAAEAAEYARRVGSISQGIEKKTYPTTSVVKASAQPVKKPTVAPKKAYVPIDNERVYSDNTSVYTKPFIGNEKKGQFKADEDFRQANEPAKGLVLDAFLPLPAASFTRGALGIDNRSGNFSEGQKKAVAYAIAKAEIAKRTTNEEGYTGSFGYDDYPNKRVGFNALHNIKKADGKFDERVSTIKETWPTVTTQTTLGRASFKKQDKDNYLVHDKYNFDEQAKNPQSIMERGEVLGRKLGIQTESNLTIPNKYVEEARQKIKLEGKEPAKSELKVASKPVVEKSTKESVQPKSRLKETYEQSKVTPKKTINKIQETSSKSSNDTKLTGERLKVQNYQKMLNEKYGANLETDGAWGPKTQAAYEKYAQ
jgi:hypothetical protein